MIGHLLVLGPVAPGIGRDATIELGSRRRAQPVREDAYQHREHGDGEYLVAVRHLRLADDEDGEQHAREAARTEPADEADGGCAHPGPNQRHAAWHDADEGEAQQSIQHHSAIEVGQRRPYQHRAQQVLLVR